MFKILKLDITSIFVAIITRTNNMILYCKLSKINFLKRNYALKFLFVTFIGIHIPLIGMLFFVLYGQHSISPNSILIFALIMTLLASGFTLFVLKKLILPIEMASKALDAYRNTRTVSDLPLGFTDEAGLLLSNIQESIIENENYIKDKEDLVHLLSHDLRTFAANPQSLSQLILEEKPSETVKEYAELIYQSTVQQFDFINAFIKLIKDEDEILKKIPKITSVKLSTIFNFVQEQVSQQLLSKNSKLSFLTEEKDVLIKMDKDLLTRVLVNLIHNAIKFSFPNSEINIRFIKEKEKMFFEIADSGIGFDSKYKEEIFKKFTSKGRLGTANEPSTGIGLYLCRKTVERFKGKLLAVSEGVNKGATFSVVFENVR